MGHICRVAGTPGPDWDLTVKGLVQVLPGRALKVPWWCRAHLWENLHPGTCRLCLHTHLNLCTHKRPTSMPIHNLAPAAQQPHSKLLPPLQFLHQIQLSFYMCLLSLHMCLEILWVSLGIL